MNPNLPIHWQLADVEKMAAYDTFQILSRRERETLRVGFIAKLAFEVEQQPNGFQGERMWVEVTSISAGCPKYVGKLVNDPLAIDLRFGAVVHFGPENVLERRSPWQRLWRSLFR